MNTDPKILRLEERVQQIEEEMKVLGIFSDFLKRIEKIEATIFLNKDIFTFKEASIVLDMSHSQLYKMARNKSIPHYKTDRKIYFIKSELIDWLKQHPRKRNKSPNDYGHK